MNLTACLELERLNVSRIVIPCNTAHYWVPDLQKAIKTPITNMVEVTTSHLQKNNINLRLFLAQQEH